MRASEKRKAQNLKLKKSFREVIKKMLELVKAEKPEEAKKLLPSIQKALDKAAKVNIITKNTAARKKSRLAKMLNKVSK
jgi:small subunit ribosomal protein S20